MRKTKQTNRTCNPLCVWMYCGKFQRKDVLEFFQLEPVTGKTVALNDSTTIWFADNSDNVGLKELFFYQTTLDERPRTLIVFKAEGAGSWYRFVGTFSIAEYHVTSSTRYVRTARCLPCCDRFLSLLKAIGFCKCIKTGIRWIVSSAVFLAAVFVICSRAVSLEENRTGNETGNDQTAIMLPVFNLFEVEFRPTR